MLLAEREKCIRIFLADQEKAARHEGRLAEHVVEGFKANRETITGLTINGTFRAMEAIEAEALPDTADQNPEPFTFSTKRDHDQYFAARAEIRALAALCAQNRQKVDQAYLACLQWMGNREVPLTVEQMDTAKSTHNTYVQPMVETIRHCETRIAELQGLIERLVRGQGG